MTIDPGVFVAVALFMAAQLIAFVGAWWNMRQKVDSHEAKLTHIEAEHKSEISALVAGHTALRETVGGIQIEIAKGFARIEQQILSLFRDQDKDKHT